MTRGSVRTLIAVALVVAIAGAAGWFVRQTRARAAWRAELPPTPDFAQRPAELRGRIQKTVTRLDGWPPDLPALAEFAQLYFANGFSSEAETALRALVRRDPQNPRWTHFLAELAANSGRIDDAIDEWRATVALAPDYAPARLKLADALLKTNRAAEAATVYQEILARAPNDAYARLGLARIAMDANRWPEAQEQLQAAIRADPLFSAAHNLLAAVAERRGDGALAEAERARAEALGRFREAPDPWIQETEAFCYDVYRLQVLASARAATGEHRAALTLLDRARALEPDNVQTHRQLGKAYWALRDVSAAKRELQAAIDLKPESPVAYLDLIAVYQQIHDIPAARELLRRGIERCPQAAGLHFELAQTLVADGQLEAALQEFAKARELEPDNLNAYEQMAVVSFRLGRDAAGAEALQAALARNPTSGPTLIMMCRYHIQQGNTEEAERFFKRARAAGAPEANLELVAQEFYRKFRRAPKVPQK